MPKPILDPQTKALIKVGFVQRIDLLFVFLIASTFCTYAFHCVFGDITFVYSLAYSVVVLTFLALWMIVLAFRTMWFVVQVMADMKTLPSDAAKLALRFSQGGSK